MAPFNPSVLYHCFSRNAKVIHESRTMDNVLILGTLTFHALNLGIMKLHAHPLLLSSEAFESMTLLRA